MQRYFRTLRRRVTLTNEELASYATAPAATVGATTTATPAAVVPYASLAEVDYAIKYDGLSLWQGDFPESREGSERLKQVLLKPEHAQKLACLATTTCDLFGFSARVVHCARSLSPPVAAAATVATAAGPLDSVSAERHKFGRFLPWQRSNVDQVPLPFVNDMDTTYEMTGAKRVAINQLGPSLSKRQATGQVAFRPEPPPPPPKADAEAVKKYKDNLMEQPPPTIIFRGKGNIKQEERDAYPEGLVVLWQDKAWVDRPIAREWAELSWKKMIDADIAAGVADESTRYLKFQDNLDAQCPHRNPAYTDYLRDECQTDVHMLPPGKTDQVQPVDRGMGRQIKCYMGQEEDAWLEDDNNLEKWEDNKLTASDRRILIATWFFEACKRAFEGAAKRKYFEHAGALMTAYGSDDDKIKLEGVPKGEKFTFMEEAEGTVEKEGLDNMLEPEPDEPEPDDVAPMREEQDQNGDLELDDDDEADEDDAPAAARVAPEGFTIALTPPSVEALAFSKEESAAADVLVGKSILYHWPVIGWHVGVLQQRITDRRIKRGGKQCNFTIFYEVDDDEVPTALQLDEYDLDDDGGWVLLQEVGEVATGGVDEAMGVVAGGEEEEGLEA